MIGYAYYDNILDLPDMNPIVKINI